MGCGIALTTCTRVTTCLDDADRRLMPFAGSRSRVGGVNGGLLG